MKLEQSDRPAMVKSIGEERSDHGRINMAHREVGLASGKTLEKARHVGELLLKQKKKIEHGFWSDWCKQSLDFSYATAKKYMRIHRRWDELKELVKDAEGMFGVESAIAALKPKPIESPVAEGSNGESERCPPARNGRIEESSKACVDSEGTGRIAEPRRGDTAAKVFSERDKGIAAWVERSLAEYREARKVAGSVRWMARALHEAAKVDPEWRKLLCEVISLNDEFRWQ